MTIELNAKFAESAQNFPCSFDSGEDFGCKMDGILPSDYEGSYEVTPSAEQQTLGTAGRTLSLDVVVKPIPGDYVGSEVPRKASADLTASGDTVSVPAGYYDEAASKAVAHGSAKAPEGTVTVNPTLEVSSEGVITATVNKALTLTPTVTPGYVSSGTSGTLTAQGSTVYQMYNRTSADLTVSGSTVTAPAGYYNEDASKTVPYTWMGNNAELVEDGYYTWSGTLKDTSYPSWTPGTSATSILATTNAKTFVADMTKYEYMLEWVWDVETAWPAGQTMSYCPMRNFGTMYQVVMRRPYGLTNFESDNWAYNYCTNDYTASCYLIYYNSSKNLTWTTTQYGVYVSALTAGGLSSTSSNTPTITPKRPVVSARCNSSYFTTTRAGQVDQENTTIKIKMNLYRMDINTSNLHYQWRKAIDMYNNPL